jgi:hypothetical protein
MHATAKRTFLACVLVAFGLVASHTSASALLRKCSRVETNDVPGQGSKCKSGGGTVRCDSETGKGYCCKWSGNTPVCTEIVALGVGPSPPVPKPPTVKLDIPPVRDVSTTPTIPRPPRLDIPPASVAPVKPPAGPVVR